MKHVSKLWILLAGISVLNTSSAQAQTAADTWGSAVVAALCGRLAGYYTGAIVADKTDDIATTVIAMDVPMIAAIAVPLCVDTVNIQHPAAALLGAVTSLIAYRVGVTAYIASLEASVQGAAGMLFGLFDVFNGPLVAVAGAGIAHAMARAVSR